MAVCFWMLLALSSRNRFKDVLLDRLALLLRNGEANLFWDLLALLLLHVVEDRLAVLLRDKLALVLGHSR